MVLTTAEQDQFVELGRCRPGLLPMSLGRHFHKDALEGQLARLIRAYFVYSQHLTIREVNSMATKDYPDGPRDGKEYHTLLGCEQIYAVATKAFIRNTQHQLLCNRIIAKFQDTSPLWIRLPQKQETALWGNLQQVVRHTLRTAEVPPLDYLAYIITPVFEDHVPDINKFPSNRLYVKNRIVPNILANDATHLATPTRMTPWDPPPLPIQHASSSSSLDQPQWTTASSVENSTSATMSRIPIKSSALPQQTSSIPTSSTSSSVPQRRSHNNSRSRSSSVHTLRSRSRSPDFRRRMDHRDDEDRSRNRRSNEGMPPPKKKPRPPRTVKRNRSKSRARERAYK